MRQLAELRSQFSAELGRAREQVAIAQERAEASERRALCELDQERTARQKSERTAEDLRGELVVARQESRDAAVAHAEARARLEAQAGALTERLAAAEQAQGRQALELERVNTELAAAQRRAERAEAEAALARQLLAELRLALHERVDGRGRRRKAGGPAPAAQNEAGEEQRGPAPTLPPEDGHGNSDSTDSDNNENRAGGGDPLDPGPDGRLRPGPRKS